MMVTTGIIFRSLVYKAKCLQIWITMVDGELDWQACAYMNQNKWKTWFGTDKVSPLAQIFSHISSFSHESIRCYDKSKDWHAFLSFTRSTTHGELRCSKQPVWIPFCSDLRCTSVQCRVLTAVGFRWCCMINFLWALGFYLNVMNEIGSVEPT